jgi:hypothetical protein
MMKNVLQIEPNHSQSLVGSRPSPNGYSGFNVLRLSMVDYGYISIAGNSSDGPFFLSG